MDELAKQERKFEASLQIPLEETSVLDSKGILPVCQHVELYWDL